MNKGPIVKTDGPAMLKLMVQVQIQFVLELKHKLLKKKNGLSLELGLWIGSSLFSGPLTASAAMRVEQSMEASELQCSMICPL